MELWQIAVCVGAAVAGVVIGIIIGVIYRKKIAEKAIGSAEQKAKEIVEEAEKDVMMKCIVPSSGNTLSKASKYSMSPYFRIEYNTEE